MERHRHGIHSFEKYLSEWVNVRETIKKRIVENCIYVCCYLSLNSKLKCWIKCSDQKRIREKFSNGRLNSNNNKTNCDSNKPPYDDHQNTTAIQTCPCLKTIDQRCKRNTETNGMAKNICVRWRDILKDSMMKRKENQTKNKRGTKRKELKQHKRQRQQHQKEDEKKNYVNDNDRSAQKTIPLFMKLR